MYIIITNHAIVYTQDKKKGGARFMYEREREVWTMWDEGAGRGDGARRRKLDRHASSIELKRHIRYEEKRKNAFLLVWKKKGGGKNGSTCIYHNV